MSAHGAGRCTQSHSFQCSYLCPDYNLGTAFQYWKICWCSDSRDDAIKGHLHQEMVVRAVSSVAAGLWRSIVSAFTQSQGFPGTRNQQCSRDGTHREVELGSKIQRILEIRLSTKAMYPESQWVSSSFTHLTNMYKDCYVPGNRTMTDT